MVARRSWVAEDEPFRRSLLATMREAIASATADELVEDSILTWRRKLGSYFTKNPVAAEEKAAKILVSLERILDARTRKNLAGVEPGDKEDIYCVLRWMMREYRHLIAIDNMDIRNKRIRLAEYVLHSLLLKLSEGTYRLLNTKNLTLRGLVGVFRPFMVEERTGGASRPQVYYIIRRLIVNDLLRYANMVNSFDLLLALRWTSRGQAGIVGRGGRGEISTKFRGLHPSYIGRIGLTAASAGDPGVSGTFVPFVKTDGQFFL